MVEKRKVYSIGCVTSASFHSPNLNSKLPIILSRDECVTKLRKDISCKRVTQFTSAVRDHNRCLQRLSLPAPYRNGTNSRKPTKFASTKTKPFSLTLLILHKNPRTSEKGERTLRSDSLEINLASESVCMYAVGFVVEVNCRLFGVLCATCESFHNDISAISQLACR